MFGEYRDLRVAIGKGEESENGRKPKQSLPHI